MRLKIVGCLTTRITGYCSLATKPALNDKSALAYTQNVLSNVPVYYCMTVYACSIVVVVNWTLQLTYTVH